MRKLISLVCVVMLSGASGFAVANDMDKHDASNSHMTTSGSSTDTRSGSVGNDQETRAGQNTRDGNNVGTPNTPPNSSNR